MNGEKIGMRHIGTGLLLLWALAATAAALWLWRERPDAPPPAEPAAEEEPEDRLDLEPASFAELSGWDADRTAEMLPAFRRSCTVLQKLPGAQPIGGDGAAAAGTAADWQAVCRRLAAVGAGDDETARAFFEAEFTPFAVTNRGDAEGLFTGYYEPSLAGSRRRGGRYRYPLYLKPPELVTVDLGRFRDDLKGRSIAGRVAGDTLEPFADRAAIDAGALGGRGLELVWVDDPVDAFFLQIQGSGRVELAEGGVLRVGYAGQNGHVYTAIGRELIERGALTREEVSMQSIRRWLAEHPEEADEVMQKNASYVFFRRLTGEGPVGSQGVALTPGRSLAVDRKFLPLGAPLWLDATAPAPGEGAPDVPVRRLLVAQDTGGAIRGPVRGDLFWGHGDEAAEVAGRMKHPGRLWLLLPRAVAERAPTATAGASG